MLCPCARSLFAMSLVVLAGCATAQDDGLSDLSTRPPTTTNDRGDADSSASVDTFNTSRGDSGAVSPADTIVAETFDDSGSADADEALLDTDVTPDSDFDAPPDSSPPDTSPPDTGSVCPAYSTPCLPVGLACSGGGYCTGFGSDCCWKCTCVGGRIECFAHAPPCP